MAVEFILDIETTGLEKETNRITCVSIKQISTNDMITIMNEDEKMLLEEVFKKLHHCETFYTFNGDGFDVPFLIYRALILNVTPPLNFKLPKHIDLRKTANCFWYNFDARQKGSLNDWCRIITGVEKQTNGLECVKAWEEKNYTLIKEHCEADVIITEKLFERCKRLGLL